jgi:hypothetical protein
MACTAPFQGSQVQTTPLLYDDWGLSKVNQWRWVWCIADAALAAGDLEAEQPHLPQAVSLSGSALWQPQRPS